MLGNSDLKVELVFKQSKTCVRTHSSHLSKFGQHHNDGGIVFPQHPPEVLGRGSQRTLRRYVSLLVPVTLSKTNNAIDATFKCVGFIWQGISKVETWEERG